MAGLIELRGFAKIVTGRGGANLKGGGNLEAKFLINFGGRGTFYGGAGGWQFGS